MTIRQGDLIWVSNKSGPAVFAAFRKLVFRNQGNFPNKHQTDKGSEFFNKWLRPFLNENGVNHFSREGDRKALMVERFNQTWQKFYYKYLESLSYQRNKQKVLDMAVSNFNRRPHSSLGGLAPSQVDLEVGNTIVRAQISQRENCRNSYSRKDKKKPSIVAYSDLRPGGTVRIAKTRGPFFKQYRGTVSKGSICSRQHSVSAHRSRYPSFCTSRLGGRTNKRSILSQTASESLSVKASQNSKGSTQRKAN